jgi:TolA-binding protein
MLKRRIAMTLAALAATAFPAVALAAQGGQEEQRAAIGEAQLAVAQVLERPAERLHRTIDVQVREIREARRERAERLAEREERRQAAAIASLGVSMSTLEAIASCESGGDPTIVSSDGTYRGKYQFDYGTWASVGGSGDPAAAPESEQDYRAALLYSQSGSSPWPVCG